MKTKILLTSFVAIMAVGAAFAAVNDGNPNIEYGNGAYIEPGCTGDECEDNINCDSTVLETSAADANVTLRALWSANVYTITLDDNGGNNGSGAIYEKYETGWYSNADAAAEHEISEVALPTKTNSVFLGYFESGASTAKIGPNGSLIGVSNTSYAAHTTLYAQFDQCEPITGNNVESVTVTGINTNNECEYTYTCSAGYSFAAGQDGTGKGNVGQAQPTTPNCVANTINLSWYNENTQYGPAPATCSYGTLIQDLPTAPSKTGFTFKGWDVVCVGEHIVYDPTVSGDNKCVCDIGYTMNPTTGKCE